MYAKALVAIDGSDFARQVLQHVPRLMPREVVLVAVMESVAAAMHRQTGVIADIPADVAKEIKARELLELRRHLRQAREELDAGGWDGPITQLVRRGKVGQQIVAVAAEESCDIILLATHGRTGIRRAMLGSVADYVISHVAGAAVLVVRP